MKDPKRTHWNQQQKILRNALEGSGDWKQARTLFLGQHAALHDSEMSGTSGHSFADEVWHDLTDDGFRRIPASEHHSIAWILWHLARIEDVTMNVLVAETPQVLNREKWTARLNVSARHTGNGMTDAEVAALSAALNMEALRAYRIAVGRRTRQIVWALQPEEMGQKVRPNRIQQIWQQQAMLDKAEGIVAYWSRRTVAGLLLMPPTRHNFVHLNEAMRVKRRRR